MKKRNKYSQMDREIDKGRVKKVRTHAREESQQAERDGQPAANPFQTQFELNKSKKSTNLVLLC